MKTMTYEKGNGMARNVVSDVSGMTHPCSTHVLYLFYGTSMNSSWKGALSTLYPSIRG